MQTFHRFRPTSHFIPPHSWSNDPCGAVYVPETKEYLWCYQWNRGTTQGGNNAWGMARSKDMITWEDCTPALTLGSSYDSKGVFSGSIISRLVEGKRVLYLFYTSVSAVPIHWSQPYINGCESQSVAISKDFGRSWQKYDQNPLFCAAPYQERTTGWRDPFVGPWNNMSRLRGVSQKTDYMLIASGEMDAASELILYESDDLLQWKKVSTLLSAQVDSPITPGSQMRWGRNFECASFAQLGGKDYLIFGVEENPEVSTRLSSRYTMWIGGEIGLDGQGIPRFHMLNFGYLDHGILYAPHIPTGANGETLQLGWLEEDNNSLAHEQGWQGVIALPRELFRVLVPLATLPQAESGRWLVDDNARTMSTLGVRPANEVNLLRKGSKLHNIRSSSSTGIKSKCYEIEGFFTKLSGHEMLTFNVRQSPKDREVTKIIISLASQTITIDRRKTSLSNGSKAPNTGFFALLNYGTASKPSYEDLHIRIFVDNSVLEVYANDRFAMSARVYPSLESSVGMSCDFKDGHRQLPESKAIVRCWEGLVNAWPARTTETVAVKVDGKNEVQTREVALPATLCA